MREKRAFNVYRPGRIEFPCQDCTERTIGCHASCPKYLAAKQEIVEAYQAQMKEARKDSMLDRYTHDEKAKNVKYSWHDIKRKR